MVAMELLHSNRGRYWAPAPVHVPIQSCCQEGSNPDLKFKMGGR